MANHGLDNVRRRERTARCAPHSSNAVAENSNAIRDLLNFIEAMADKEDGTSLLADFGGEEQKVDSLRVG